MEDAPKSSNNTNRHSISKQDEKPDNEDGQRLEPSGTTSDARASEEIGVAESGAPVPGSRQSYEDLARWPNAGVYVEGSQHLSENRFGSLEAALVPLPDSVEGSQCLSDETSIGSVAHCVPLPDSVDGSQYRPDGSEHTRSQDSERAHASNPSTQASFAYNRAQVGIVTEEQSSPRTSITILAAPQRSNSIKGGRLERHGSLQQEDEEDTGSRWKRTYENLAYDTSLRLLVVEDLSPGTIEDLGSMFSPDPEVFAEHLNNSQYKPGNYLDANPSTNWPTRGLPKQWSSIRWWRPVRMPESELGHNRWKSLLNDKKFTWKTVKRHLEIAPRTRSEEERNSNHIIEPIVNIFRTEWSPLSSKVDTTEPIAWEERATLCQVDDACYFLLLDPLPVLSYTVDDTKQKDWCPWNQLRPRGRPPTALHGNMHSAEVRQLRSYLTSTRSTSEDFLSWTSNASNTIDSDTGVGMSDALLRIVQTDTFQLLDIISETLDKINRETINENLLQDRLSSWRTLMARYLLELPKISKSLDEFGSFAEDCGISTQLSKRNLKNIFRRLDQAIEQVSKAYNSLRTGMSILDSRRSIAEAESVGKLTELAFIFIPISFVASAFSMQIQELQEPAPLYAFFVVSLGVVLGSYGLCLLARSQVLLRPREALFKSVKEYANIQPNRPISTRKFLAFILFDQKVLWFGAVVAAISVSIIVPMWVEAQLDVGFKAVITVMMFLVIAFTAYCLLYFREDGVFNRIGVAIATRERGLRRRARVRDGMQTEDNQV